MGSVTETMLIVSPGSLSTSLDETSIVTGVSTSVMAVSGLATGLERVAITPISTRASSVVPFASITM